jgi:protein gp37
MADGTGIEWTDATWNPVRGCSRVSEGCRNCYAERVAARFSGPGLAYEGLTDKHGRWNATTRLVAEHLDDPLRWKRPRKIFVNSMSDLFHESLSDEQIAAVFGMMAAAPQHTFQVLTKRPARMLRFFQQGDPIESFLGAAKRAGVDVSFVPRDYSREAPLPNVWLGVSVEDQKAADERIPFLKQTPAAVRFLSMEPLLGDVRLKKHMFDLDVARPGDCAACGHGHGFTRCPNYGDVAPSCHHTGCGCPGFRHTTGSGIDWVIAGGESGHGARPMHPEWARSLRDQCFAAGVPFFFKQWGEWAAVDQPWAQESPKECADNEQWLNLAGGMGFHGEEVWRMRRVGKKLAGRLLDGVEHSAFPEVGRGF